jgi:hypothetical protein
MDTQQIIEALKQQRERLDSAIAVLGGSSRASSAATVKAASAVPRRGSRQMSQQARARIAAAQRRRWAKVKAKQAAASGATAKKK